MGNASLLIIVATTLSGILLLSNTQRISAESDLVQQQLQEDVLARELAYTGHSLVMSDMQNGTALKTSRSSLALGSQPLLYKGGEIQLVQYNLNPGAQTLDFWVLGKFGQAQHLIHSKYLFRSDFPASIVADVPYMRFNLDENARIYGGLDDKPFLLGTENFNQLTDLPGIGSLVDLQQMENEINNELQYADDGLPGNITEVTIDHDQSILKDALPDLDQYQTENWLDEFYYKALDIIHPVQDGGPDYYFDGAKEFGAETPEQPEFGQDYFLGSLGESSIVRIKGDLLVRPGSAVIGHGILIVEGNMKVEPGAALEWNGFIYARPPQQAAVLDLQGTFNLKGAFLASQEAVPPGGHLDVTSNRDLSGVWSLPRGTQTNQGLIPIAGPWFVHQHKWDEEWNGRPAISPGREVNFIENSTATSHESSHRFKETLNDMIAAGYTSVNIQFDNPGLSGMGSFHMRFNDGTGLRNFSGSIAAGFDGSGSVSSPSFHPGNLIDLRMQFRSLRHLNLMKDPDPNSSQDGAHRVANSSHRMGSFTVKIVDSASGRLLHSVAVYQHVREDELDEEQEDLNQLKEDIESGELGLEINMGPNATMAFDTAALNGIMSRLGATALDHLGSWNRHCGRDQRGCDLSVVNGNGIELDR